MKFVKRFSKFFSKNSKIFFSLQDLAAPHWHPYYSTLCGVCQEGILFFLHTNRGSCVARLMIPSTFNCCSLLTSLLYHIMWSLSRGFLHFLRIFFREYLRPCYTRNGKHSSTAALSPWHYELYHVSGFLSIGKMHKICMKKLCKMLKNQNSARCVRHRAAQMNRPFFFRNLLPNYMRFPGFGRC